MAIDTTIVRRMMQTTDAYKEEAHPRNENGQWTSKGSGSGSKPGVNWALPTGVSHAVARTKPLPSSWEKHRNWKQQAYGGVIVNNEGKFLLREPADHFDGYAWTFPKGKMDNPDEHPVDVAAREVKEETGYNTKIFGALPTTFRSGSGSHSNFFLMQAQGEPGETDYETAGLKWLDYDDAKKHIKQSKNWGGRKRDLAILEQAHAGLSKHYGAKATDSATTIHRLLQITDADWDESKIRRDDDGQFAPKPSGSSESAPQKTKGQIAAAKAHATRKANAAAKSSAAPTAKTAPATSASADPASHVTPKAHTPEVSAGSGHQADKEFASIQKRGFTPIGAANVGGMHGGKEFWKDADGKKWLFKPGSSHHPSFVPYAEEAAYKIGRLINPKAVEVRAVNVGGKAGTVQPWSEGAKQTISNDLTKLNSAQLGQIQAEQVIDWLTSNHDSHKNQFAILPNGELLPIDKGQAFKYVESDKLHPDYHPNAAYGEDNPIYKYMHNAAKNGKIKLNPQETKKAIARAQAIPDKDLIEAVKPYAEGRYSDPAARQKFYDSLIQRKQNLAKDFGQFWKDVPGMSDVSELKKATDSATLIRQMMRATDAEWDESKIKRDKEGKFADKPSGGESQKTKAQLAAAKAHATIKAKKAAQAAAQAVGKAIPGQWQAAPTKEAEPAGKTKAQLAAAKAAATKLAKKKQAYLDPALAEEIFKSPTIETPQGEVTQTPFNEKSDNPDELKLSKALVDFKKYNMPSSEMDHFDAGEHKKVGIISAKLKENKDVAALGKTLGNAYGDPVKSAVSTVISKWAGTSADHSEEAIALQLAAQKAFGGTTNHLSGSVKAKAKTLEEKHEAGYRAILDAMYEETQNYFKSKGIKELTLYRGQSVSPGGKEIKNFSAAGSTVKVMEDVELQPLSSFSTRPLGFGGGNAMIVGTIPVENILSTGGTGLGTAYEHEVVVVGGIPGQMWVLNKIHGDTEKIEKVIHQAMGLVPPDPAPTYSNPYSSSSSSYKPKKKAKEKFVQKTQAASGDPTKTYQLPSTMTNHLNQAGMTYSQTMPSGEFKFKKGDLRLYIDPKDHSFKAKNVNGEKLGTGSSSELGDWLKKHVEVPF